MMEPNQDRILALLETPHFILAKSVYSLECQVADLERTLFYAKAMSNAIIKDQREIIVAMDKTIKDLRRVNQK